MKKLILSISLLAAFSAQAVVIVAPHVSVPAVHVAVPVRVAPPAVHVAPTPAPRVAVPVKAATPAAGAAHEATTPKVITPVIVPHTPVAPAANRPASAASKAK